MLAPKHCLYSRETWILLWSSCSDSLWESGPATLADTVASFFAYFFRDLRSAKWQGDKRWQPVEFLLCLCLKELFSSVTVTSVSAKRTVMRTRSKNTSACQRRKSERYHFRFHFLVTRWILMSCIHYQFKWIQPFGDAGPSHTRYCT